MPSMYRNISTGLWSAHQYFRNLSPRAKFVYLYLLTAPCSSELSLFPFPLLFQTPSLGLKLEELEAVILALEKEGLVIYDRETEEILVCKYFENHKPNAGLTYEMYRNDLGEIKSEALIDELVEISKNYTISLAYYAALADRRPYLENWETMNLFHFKDKEMKSLDEVRSAASRGRASR